MVVGIGDRFLLITLISAIALKFLQFYYFLPFFCVLISAWILYQYNEKQYWHRVGVPGPKTSIFFGSTAEMGRKGFIELDLEMYQKFGNSYGTHFLDRREFNTKDPEILRQIFIKEFWHFSNRLNIIPTLNSSNPKGLLRNGIAQLIGENWKRVRNRVTPAFTSGKIKKLIPTFCESTERLCAIIEKDYIPEGKELPVKELFGRLVLDEIGRAGFSLDLNTFDENVKNPFVENTRALMRPITQQPWAQQSMFKLMLFCPFFIGLFGRLTGRDLFHTQVIQFFEQMMNNLYEKRRADPEAKEKYSDIFQFLINAVDESESAEAPVDSDIVHKEMVASAPKADGKRLISRMELFAQSFTLLVAGFDTTATTLSFAAYLLAVHPEIQQQLREEIVEKVLTYEQLRRMHFLQAVVQETLRMYPIAPKLNRECSEACTINGIQFCKGDVVSMPVYVIQHDEDVFREPYKFDPERFMPDQKSARDPLAFLTFGLGPRNCIGMRVAEFQMQVALALLCQRFRFLPGHNTPKFPPKLVSNEMILRSAEPLVVCVEKI